MGFIRIDPLDARNLMGFLYQRNGHISMDMFQGKRRGMENYMADFTGSFRKHSKLRLCADPAFQA